MAAKLRLIEWEHPQYGTLGVLFDGDLPVAVEFDLFTPDSEKAVINLELAERRARVKLTLPLA